MQKNFFFSFMFFVSLHFVNAQGTTVKVVDLKTNESIPYANVTINKTENLVSNAEGYFSVSDLNGDESSMVAISYLGYISQAISLAEIKRNGNVIRLQPGVYELDAVDVSKTKPDPNTIMAQVKKNLQQNYSSGGHSSKDMLFMRTGTSMKASKLDFEIDKSTGFSKQSLKSANSELKRFTSNIISHPPLVFTDILANYYKVPKSPADKVAPAPKLEVVKATKMKDENRSISFDELEQTAGKIVLQHLDSTKYYRIKSGWFGSRDTISLRKDFNKNKKKKKDAKNHLTASRDQLSQFLYTNNFAQSSTLDFVKSPEIYEYTYDGAMYSAENEFVYVLKFKPKKSRANFQGTLYISETDYAVVRADFGLAPGKKLDGINLKLLLGVKMSENVSRGTLIYAPNPSGTGYYLRYASTETGQYFYINRPLKFIELTDEEKDVVSFDIKVEGSSVDKVEFLNISHDEISADQYAQVKEEDFNYIALKRYDPSIWKNYSAIEPLEEMKQFKVVE